MFDNSFDSFKIIIFLLDWIPLSQLFIIKFIIYIRIIKSINFSCNYQFIVSKYLFHFNFFIHFIMKFGVYFIEFQ